MVDLGDDFQKATEMQALDQQIVTREAIKAIKAEQKARLDVLDAAAIDILTSGDPIGTFRNGFSLNHSGDDEILRAVIYAKVLQSSRTSKGLQIFINGDKGSGKSSAVKAAANLIPPDKLIEGSFSDKAFFLKLAGKTKTVVFLDDIMLSDAQVGTLKRAMTNYQQASQHNTIVDHKLEIQSIPARTLWLGSAVSETGDDQLKDRFLTLGIQNSPENDMAYINWELQRRKEGRPENAVNDDVILSRAVLQHISDREFVVAGFERVDFAYVNDRRLINICLDLCEANAILHYLQREHTERDGVITVHPTTEDLNAALMFSMFNLTDKSADGRLTKSERALDDSLQINIGTDKTFRDFSEGQIVETFGKSLTRVRTLLYGRDGSPVAIKGGLLEKCPWYSIDADPETRRNVIRVQRHVRNDFGQFATVSTIYTPSTPSLHHAAST